MTDSLLSGLNEPQRRAVSHTEGPLLVLAGAGSGKTRVITRRIAYILGRGLAEPGEIAGLTFTNKAAEEMRERVAGLVGKQKAAELVLSTFHSFCVRVLRANAGHVGYRKDFTISTEGDTRILMRRVLTDLDGSTKTSFDADLLLSAVGTMKNSATTAEDSAPTVADEQQSSMYKRWLPEIYDRYQSALRAANSVDFDDLLTLTLQLWREHPGVLKHYQERFRYVMVDEFQDTNRIQFELVRMLVGKRRNLCVVGDDDQSIYAWRGADPRNILEFDTEFPGATVVALEQNYRSTQTILDAANAVIANNVDRRAKKLWSALGAGRPIDWITTADDAHEAKTAVAWLQHIKEKTGAAWSDFAVLYRSNTQSRAMEIGLRGASIPFVVFGGQEFFERAEVKDIVSYLKVLANPRDEASFLRIVNMPRRGIGDVTLHRIHELCRQESLPLLRGMAEALKREMVSGEAREGIQSLLTLFRELRERGRERKESMTTIVDELLTRIDYRGELRRTAKSGEQALVRWNNVEAILDAIAEYERATPDATLSGFLDQSALGSNEDRRTKRERRGESVSLMTIHSAKGLEFPFVLLLGAEEGLLPHERSLGPEGVEEERRLFYVALTRAQRHITLFQALNRGRKGRERSTQPSRFVGEIPSTVLRAAAFAVRPDEPSGDAEPAPVPKKSVAAKPKSKTKARSKAKARG